MTGRKRSNEEGDWGPAKRGRWTGRQGRSIIKDDSSVRQQAEKYRLATAKIPLAVMTRRWEKGKNRGLSRGQVARLQSDFRELGLFREAEENYMLVQCSASAVERMTARPGLVEAVGREWIYDFEDWESVNGDERVEVMDGQHRMEALRQYGAEQPWWTCRIYDKGEFRYDKFWEHGLIIGCRRECRAAAGGTEQTAANEPAWVIAPRLPRGHVDAAGTGAAGGQDATGRRKESGREADTEHATTGQQGYVPGWAGGDALEE